MQSIILNFVLCLLYHLVLFYKRMKEKDEKIEKE